MDVTFQSILHTVINPLVPLFFNMSEAFKPAQSFGSYKPPITKAPRKRKSESLVDGGKVENFYAIMNTEKKYQTEECHYDNEEVIQIKIPFMMSISGKTGSGKTNCIMDIVKKINCWEKIFLCARDPTEPLYQWFQDKIQEVEKKTGMRILTVIDDVAKLPDVDDFMAKRDQKNPIQMLFIFDDLITEKDKLLKRVEKYFIKGRKVFASCAFLSQSYYAIPKTIRKNCGYIILKQIAQITDLKRILADYKDIGISFEKLYDLYKTAIDSDPFNFFMIDLITKDSDLRFRINYKGISPSEWQEDFTSQSSSSSSSYSKDEQHK